jgi:cytochrome c oxidase cbb3-type subunit 3
MSGSGKQHIVQNPDAAGSGHSVPRSWIWAVVVTVLLAGLWHWLHLRSLETTLLRSWPDEVEHSAQLMQFALSVARPAYDAHCASCHGTSSTGNRALGAPSLSDSTWLYGKGNIADIETTILYGIRSGHPKSHNVTDMPAEGRTHQLSEAEIGDVVEYLLTLSQHPHDEGAGQRGRALFYDKGNCFDCHGGDARGNSDYGAPPLLGPNWLYGGDRLTLSRTVYSGRHGRCPAWINTLTPVQIRALAVYLYARSH